MDESGMAQWRGRVRKRTPVLTDYTAIMVLTFSDAVRAGHRGSDSPVTRGNRPMPHLNYSARSSGALRQALFSVRGTLPGANIPALVSVARSPESHEVDLSWWAEAPTSATCRPRTG
jgi:hypothetical protein